MQTYHRTLTLSTLLWFGLLGMALAGDRGVSFDVNPLAPAYPIERQGLTRAWNESRFVAVRLQLSSMVHSTSTTEIDEFLFRIESRREEIQVADYSPKTEMTSNTLGNVQVMESSQQHQQASLQGAAGYPGVGSIDGNAHYYKHFDQQRVYVEKPTMSLLTSAGTLARRTGVYFKVKRSPQAALEGVHEVEVVFEVPSQWRGDLLEVSMEAFGKSSPGSRSPRSLSQGRFLVAVYLNGDSVAAEVARGHAQMEQRIRQIAQLHAEEIRRRSEPTPLHKIGVAFDLVEPGIPNHWLSDVLFGNLQYPTASMSRLPVDVRVAILDYVDHRQAMETLANPKKFVSYR